MKFSTSATVGIVIAGLLALMAPSGEASTRFLAPTGHISSSLIQSTQSQGVSGSASPGATGDWPMYGHDVSRTNFNPDEHTINSGNVNRLVQRWQEFIGS